MSMRNKILFSVILVYMAIPVLTVFAVEVEFGYADLYMYFNFSDQSPLSQKYDTDMIFGFGTSVGVQLVDKNVFLGINSSADLPSSTGMRSYHFDYRIPHDNYSEYVYASGIGLTTIAEIGYMLPFIPFNSAVFLGTGFSYGHMSYSIIAESHATGWRYNHGTQGGNSFFYADLDFTVRALIGVASLGYSYNRGFMFGVGFIK